MAALEPSCRETLAPASFSVEQARMLPLWEARARAVLFREPQLLNLNDEEDAPALVALSLPIPACARCRCEDRWIQRKWEQNLQVASSPRTDTVDPANRAAQDPGPTPEFGSLALSRLPLAAPSGENDTRIEAPSSENLACRYLRSWEHNHTYRKVMIRPKILT